MDGIYRVSPRPLIYSLEVVWFQEAREKGVAQLTALRITVLYGFMCNSIASARPPRLAPPAPPIVFVIYRMMCSNESTHPQAAALRRPLSFTKAVL